MTVEIYLSGLHDGPAPSPGVGTARSLRLAFPEATLIGIDYSGRSPAPHWPDVDDVRVLPRWSDIDPAIYACQIESQLLRGAIWISGLDLEALLLSDAIQGHDLLLVPPRTALAAVMRPGEALGGNGAIAVPPTLPADASLSELHTFCRLHGWKVWLKDPFGSEAWPIRSWADLLTLREYIGPVWDTRKLSLQAHVNGHEELVGLAAFRGRLIDACLMTNPATVSGRTTRNSAIGEVPAGLLAALSELLAGLLWTGGAEVRITRDPRGKRWLTGIRPRFPAWIHAATLAARNLPELLVRAATGEAPVDSSHHRPNRGRDGMRVFPEAPAPRDAGLAAPLDSGPGSPRQPGSPRRGRDESLLSHDLEKHVHAGLVTPCRVFVWSNTVHRWAGVKAPALPAVSDRVALRIAYSIKTNPEEEVLALARSQGLLAEAISQLEVRRALAAGFAPGDIILNGPGKWWPERDRTRMLRAVFCDSLVELAQVEEWLARGDRVAEVVGVRLRPPPFASRFGVPVVPWKRFQELVGQIRRLPAGIGFGVHVHMPPSVIGVQKWWSLVHSILSWASTLEAITERPVRCLDLGGGWYPDDWDRMLRPRLGELIEVSGASLIHLEDLILEPGRALVQSAMAVLTRVLEVRPSSDNHVEVVVDAAIAEIPDHSNYPHRILIRHPESGRWAAPRRGWSRILGRSCMEHDILATDVELPAGLKPGDLLAIADAGAYDRSKSYAFGCG